LKVVSESAVIAPKQSCSKNLGSAGDKAPQSALVDTMATSIAALRLIGGGQAFAFYHGVGEHDYLVPMVLEGGEWKVAALTAEEIRGS
jgi:hypothetical protein